MPWLNIKENVYNKRRKASLYIIIIPVAVKRKKKKQGGNKSIICNKPFFPFYSRRKEKREKKLVVIPDGVDTMLLLLLMFLRCSSDKKGLLLFPFSRFIYFYIPNNFSIELSREKREKQLLVKSFVCRRVRWESGFVVSLQYFMNRSFFVSNLILWLWESFQSMAFWTVVLLPLMLWLLIS